MPHLRERRNVSTRSPKAQEEHTARAQFRSFLSWPSLISAPSTRANQPSPVQGRQEREPCRLLWVAPRRLAPGRVENGGGRGNCSVKLGRVNMHVGSPGKFRGNHNPGFDRGNFCPFPGAYLGSHTPGIPGISGSTWEHTHPGAYSGRETRDPGFSWWGEVGTQVATQVMA